MRTKRHFLLATCYVLASYAFVGWVLAGCAKHTTTKIPQDLTELSQDARVYVSQSYKISQEQSAKLAELYFKLWSQPWNDMEINPHTNEVFWMLDSLLKNPGFGENLLPNSLDFTQRIYQDMEIDTYPNAKTKAIIVRESDVRAVPTDKPYFKSKDGYPFDRWQNSRIFAGTPVLITHFDSTKQWAHIQTNFVYGWVRVDDLAYISDDQIALLMDTKQSTTPHYITPNTDNIGLYSQKGDFVGLARIGQIFRIATNQPKSHQDTKLVYVFSRESNGSLQISLAQVRDSDFSEFPQKLTPYAMAEILNTMIGDKYGWGGYLGNRDCSAFVRDSFGYFGVYLPRNSQAQAHYAKNMIDLRTKSREEKERYIIENATPFATILWLKGHIMIYLGTYNNKALVAHSVWSVSTSTIFSKTQNMFGGVVISTLYAGAENNGRFSHTLLVDRILGMSDLYMYMEGL